MKTFEPVLSILSEAQQKIWPLLADMPDLGFTLYGGTALALHLGHRSSVDFDFFSNRPLDKILLRQAIPMFADAKVLQDQSNTLTVIVDGGVKISLFGGMKLGRLRDPVLTHDYILEVASIEDILAMKLKVIFDRSEAKDYRDIARILARGYRLADGLGGARALFGKAFQASEALKALVYFGDGDLHTLPASTRELIEHAVATVGEIPTVYMFSKDVNESRPSHQRPTLHGSSLHTRESRSR
ncbi:MAG: nucleotidyl transferase AbiEii/AbiGii toxin family protein [Candidatus Eremiobacteraeota bacterium]|nr:nucleotidyl transferase AbiEii/AbiGii toxin family protein [Candidatus Eremiobacteraeota bacterium]